MGEAEPDALRARQCRRCRSSFFVCRPCDRGQQYCSQACRGSARKEQLSAARLRHQRSDAGREDHRDHQRALRERKRLVMDQPSGEGESVDMLATVSLAEWNEPDEEETEGELLYAWCPERPCCRFCGRESVYLEWG